MKKTKLFIGYNEKAQETYINFEEAAINQNVLIIGPSGSGKGVFQDNLLTYALTKKETEDFELKVLCLGFEEFLPFDRFAKTKHIGLQEPRYSKESSQFFDGLHKMMRERQALLQEYNCSRISDLPRELGIKNVITLITNFHLLKKHYEELLTNASTVGLYIIGIVNFVNDIPSHLLKHFSKIMLVGYIPYSSYEILKEHMPFLASNEEVSVELGEALIFDKSAKSCNKLSVPFFTRNKLLETLEGINPSERMEELIVGEKKKMLTQTFLKSLTGEERIGLFYATYYNINSNKKLRLVVDEEVKEAFCESMYEIFPFQVLGAPTSIALAKNATKRTKIIVATKDEEIPAGSRYETMSMKQYITKGITCYYWIEKENTHLAELLSGNVDRIRVFYKKWRKMFGRFINRRRRPAALYATSFYDFLAQLEDWKFRDHTDIHEKLKFYYHLEGEQFTNVLLKAYTFLRTENTLNYEAAVENIMQLVWEFDEDDANMIMQDVCSASIMKSFFQMKESEIERHMAKIDLLEFIYPLFSELHMSKEQIISMLKNVPRMLLFSDRTDDIWLLMVDTQVVGCKLVNGSESYICWSHELEEINNLDYQIIQFPKRKKEMDIEEIIKAGWDGYYE